MFKHRPSLLVVHNIEIVLTFRLHTQLRIKIHINLFVALALYDFIHLIYQLTIRAPDVAADMLKENSVSILE